MGFIAQSNECSLHKENSKGTLPTCFRVPVHAFVLKHISVSQTPAQAARGQFPKGLYEYLGRDLNVSHQMTCDVTHDVEPYILHMSFP